MNYLDEELCTMLKRFTPEEIVRALQSQISQQHTFSSPATNVASLQDNESTMEADNTEEENASGTEFNSESSASNLSVGK